VCDDTVASLGEGKEGTTTLEHLPRLVGHRITQSIPSLFSFLYTQHRLLKVSSHFDTTPLDPPIGTPYTPSCPAPPPPSSTPPFPTPHHQHTTMNFFNRSKTRTPQESARMLRDYLVRLDAPGSPESKRKVRL
jgi:hypothetical protein